MDMAAKLSMTRPDAPGAFGPYRVVAVSKRGKRIESDLCRSYWQARAVRDHPVIRVMQDITGWQQSIEEVEISFWRWLFI